MFVALWDEFEYSLLVKIRSLRIQPHCPKFFLLFVALNFFLLEEEIHFHFIDDRLLLLGDVVMNPCFVAHDSAVKITFAPFHGESLQNLQACPRALLLVLVGPISGNPSRNKFTVP